jgi:hypothetical protein
MTPMTVIITDKDVTDVRAVIPVVVQPHRQRVRRRKRSASPLSARLYASRHNGANPVNATGRIFIHVRLPVGEYRLRQPDFPQATPSRQRPSATSTLLKQPSKSFGIDIRAFHCLGCFVFRRHGFSRGTCDRR